MLQPLRQLRRVQEYEIQLPPSVQDNQRLADEVRQCIRDMEDEEPFVEVELLKDWKKYLSMSKKLVKWEKKEDLVWKKRCETDWMTPKEKHRSVIYFSGAYHKLNVMRGCCWFS